MHLPFVYIFCFFFFFLDSFVPPSEENRKIVAAIKQGKNPNIKQSICKTELSIYYFFQIHLILSTGFLKVKYLGSKTL